MKFTSDMPKTLVSEMVTIKVGFPTTLVVFVLDGREELDGMYRVERCVGYSCQDIGDNEAHDLETATALCLAWIQAAEEQETVTPRFGA